MRNHKQYKLLSVVLILAYMLSACGSVPALPGGQLPQGDQSQEVVFGGTVEAMGAGQWVVSGRSVSFSNSTAVDANIQVGDPVKVEAVVDQDGNVTALRIESASPDDLASGNSNDVSTNDGNLTDNAANSNDGPVGNSNSEDSNANANGNANGNDNTAGGPEQEVSGMVQAITTESITIDGVVYMISDFTEFKDLIVVGDTVKVHATASADGTFTVREIEKSSGVGDDDSSNSNGSDDSDDSNENANSNDDDDDDDENENGNDDGDDDDNENDSGSGHND
jgi:hypothetical protein